DRRAVLRAAVVALTIQGGGVVVLPERLEQRLRVGPGAVICDEHRLRVTGATGAHLLIRRVWRLSAHVAGGRGDHAGKLPEHPLRAPETAHRDIQDLAVLSPRFMERGAEHLVRRGDVGERFGPTLEGATDDLRAGLPHASSMRPAGQSITV